MLQLLKRWTRTEHEVCQENLSAFLDGQLTSGKRSQVERHLKECEPCRADLESLRQTVSLLRAVPQVQLPRTFSVPASESVKQRQLYQQRVSYGYVRMATALATILLLLVVSGDTFLRFQPALSPQTVTQLAPAPALATGDNQAASSAPTDSSAVSMAAETVPAAEAVTAAQPPLQPLVGESATADQGEGLLKVVEATAAATTQLAVEPAAAPSDTFGRSAGALAAPTTSGTPPALPPSPGEVTPEPITTATFVPTPIPPTIAPLPTLTPLPPTATPEPSFVGETKGDDLAPPVQPSGVRAFLEALRPFLSWLETILSLTLVLLLLTMWWLRRGVRTV